MNQRVCSFYLMRRVHECLQASSWRGGGRSFGRRPTDFDFADGGIVAVLREERGSVGVVRIGRRVNTGCN